jgi:hypothetical protein
MNVLIDAEVIANRRWSPIIELIMELAAVGRHDLDYDTLDDLRNAGWVRENSSDMSELLGHIEKAQSVRGLSVAKVMIQTGVADSGLIGAEGETVVSPLRALEFLYTPFQIVLENEEFDGAFLLWMARALRRDDFLRAYRLSKVDFRHAGGKGSIDRSIRLLSSRVWGRADRKYSREMSKWAAVIIDSDSKHPGHSPNVAIIDRVRDKVAFSHLLSKRAIESYLPKSFIIKKLPALRLKVESLFSMSPEQRKHYHMKNGMKVDGQVLSKASYQLSTKPSSEEKALFSSLDDHHWNLLAPGFGASLAEIYVNESCRPDNSGIISLIDPDDALELDGVFTSIMRAC